MAPPQIGRIVRRVRQERGLTQAALASTLGISASYLNLIEHDQRGVTASVLIKLAEALGIDLAELSGQSERKLEAGLREALSDPHLATEDVPIAEIAQIAGASPSAARAVLALYRAYRAAREDASGIALPSGRRIMLPHEEARDFFNDRGNYFQRLEERAEILVAELQALPAEMNHAIAERLRRRHDLSVRVVPLEGALRVYEPEARQLLLSEQLPRESRGFQLAFQLALLEARGAVEAEITAAKPSSTEAASLMRVGLLNYVAGALLMPYRAMRENAGKLRHDIEALAARFSVSYEQVCHRLATLQRPGDRGVPFFFLRTDLAGNVSKRFAGAGFPFVRFGGSCPRWVAHTAFATPGEIRVQVAQLPDGATFLCFARTVSGFAPRWGEPAPIYVVAMGCEIGHAAEMVYSDGIDPTNAAVGIGLSCRLCDRQNCRSRAFPPLEHRIAVDPHTTSASPYRFEGKVGKD